MLKLFRTISILEGFSYIAILCVTFGLISREFVFPLGVAHGALFMVYLTLSLIVSGKQGWSVFVWLLLFSASLIPLAFIPTEMFLRKKLSQIQKNPA